MDKDINKNVTPEQKANIESQDTTQPGLIDVSVLEQKSQPLPEQPVTKGSEGTIASAESVLTSNEKERTALEKAQAERTRIAERNEDQESIVRTLGGEQLGRGEAEAQAFDQAGIAGTQSEIDSLDQAILSASTALKSQEVADNQAVEQIAFSSRGIPLGIVQGKQAMLASQQKAERRTMAIELENDIATSQLLQGKVDSAKKSIERAVKLKYADKKAELEQEISWLSRSDSKLAGAKKAELAEIQKLEDEEKAVSDIVLQARQAGANQSEIRDILSQDNANDAIAAAPSLGKLARMDMAIKSQTLSNMRDAQSAAAQKAQGLKTPKEVETARENAKDLINLGKIALGDENKRGFGRLVGSTIFGRGIFGSAGTGANVAFGQEANVRSSVSSILASTWVESIREAKEAGLAGSMSDAEGAMIAQLDLLAGYVERDDKNKITKIVGSEEDVRNAIQNFQKNAEYTYLENGGELSTDMLVADELAPALQVNANGTLSTGVESTPESLWGSALSANNIQ